MLPLSIVHRVATHQYFAHSYLGVYRHAFTVGFVTLMILGVAGRVVPILAGGGFQANQFALGPFILFNVGNIGRLTL
jgi:hypothetical protein